MICVRMQPGRIDKLEPATGPPDYIPRSRSRMAEVSNAIVENPVFTNPEAHQLYMNDNSSSNPWRTSLLSNSGNRDEGLGAALAGHKRPRAESSTSTWSDLATLARDLEIQTARPATLNPLGEVVTKATESRSSPTGGAAGYSSSPSWCSSDSGIQHSDICCKPYFSPPRTSNPGTTQPIPHVNFLTSMFRISTLLC